MIFPATTVSLPKHFRPRRRPAESRPLRELPPAFLCAMARYSSFFFAVFLAAGFFAVPLLASDFLAATLGAAFAAGFFAAAFFAPAFFSAGAFSLATIGVLSGLLPSVRISVIRNTVRFWRWPFLRR